MNERLNMDNDRRNPLTKALTDIEKLGQTEAERWLTRPPEEFDHLMNGRWESDQPAAGGELEPGTIITAMGDRVRIVGACPEEASRGGPGEREEGVNRIVQEMEEAEARIVQERQEGEGARQALIATLEVIVKDWQWRREQTGISSPESPELLAAKEQLRCLKEGKWAVVVRKT